MFFKKQNFKKDYSDFIEKIEFLRDSKDDPISRIVSYDFDKLYDLVNKAVKNEIIIPTNMYDANRIPLEMLQKGDVFRGVSAIINPYDWAHDEALLLYKNANQAAAKRGVKIERTFVLQKDSDVEAMRPIMDDQVSMGIDVRYVLESKLKTLSYFPDFTVIPKYNLIIYVPNLANLKTCVVVRDKQLQSEIMRDYKMIQRYVSQWEGLS